MYGAAELEIAITRRDDGDYGVDLRFHRDDSDADTRLLARFKPPVLLAAADSKAR